MAQEPRYRFGPLEPHGFIGGLRIGQVVVLGGGLRAAFLLLLTTKQPVGPILVGIVALALAFVPIGARTLEQWAPIALRHGLRRVTGRHRWTTPAPTAGHRLRRGRDRSVIEAPVALPPALRGLSIRTVVDRGLLPAGVQPGIGIVRDARGGTYTGVLRAHGRAFALL